MVHGLSSSTDTTEVAWQTPLRHTSLVVQALPSSHAVPSALRGLEQTPVAGSQAPASWHWLSAAQTTGVPAAHWPAPSQVSAPLQALPSEHDVPAATAAWCTPVDGSQLSTVQGFPSSTATAVP